MAIGDGNINIFAIKNNRICNCIFLIYHCSVKPFKKIGRSKICRTTTNGKLATGTKRGTRDINDAQMEMGRLKNLLDGNLRLNSYVLYAHKATLAIPPQF
jgi:hypothetical protein